MLYLRQCQLILVIINHGTHSKNQQSQYCFKVQHIKMHACISSRGRPAILSKKFVSVIRQCLRSVCSIWRVVDMGLLIWIILFKICNIRSQYGDFYDISYKPPSIPDHCALYTWKLTMDCGCTAEKLITTRSQTGVADLNDRIIFSTTWKFAMEVIMYRGTVRVDC